MKIVKTKTIEAKDVSEISDKTLIDFKDRVKLHKDSIPDFFVYIQDYAWNAFISHSTSVYQQIRCEAQGIFVGHYFKDQFGEFVVATTYEECYGNSQSAYVEMSEECLAKISEKCQKNETLMLVQIHTHPGFGVFYSGTDYNCLKTNFYKPYQIGIVVDILKKQDKGFKTKGNNVVEFSDYALFNDEKNILFSPYSKIEIVKKGNGRIDELTEEVKRLTNELQDATITISELQDFLQIKESEIEQIKKKLKHEEKNIEYLNSNLQDKTANINQLQEGLKKKESEIEQFKEELQSKEKNIECLNSDLQTKTTDITQLQEELQGKISEIEQLKEELDSKISEINQLKTREHKKHSWLPWKKNKQK